MNSTEEGPEQPRAGGPIVDQQNFFAGLVLICLAVFAFWASSDLPLGRLSAFGPGLLPRIVIAIIGLFGLVLAGTALIQPGEKVRFADFSAMTTIAGVAIVSGGAAFVLGRAGFTTFLGLNAFAVAFTILYIALMLWLVRLSMTSPEWLDRSGLRGPIFVIGGLIAFALTVRTVGLLVAGPLLAIISGAASNETKPRELVIFALVITVFCIALFKYGLKLPMPVLIVPGIIYL